MCIIFHGTGRFCKMMLLKMQKDIISIKDSVPKEDVIYPQGNGKGKAHKPWQLGNVGGHEGKEF